MVPHSTSIVRVGRARPAGNRPARPANRARDRGGTASSNLVGSSDVVTVTRIDRLARSTFGPFAIVKGIVDAGGLFRSLAEPWADTSTSTGRLMIS